MKEYGDDVNRPMGREKLCEGSRVVSILARYRYARFFRYFFTTNEFTEKGLQAVFDLSRQYDIEYTTTCINDNILITSHRNIYTLFLTLCSPKFIWTKSFSAMTF